MGFWKNKNVLITGISGFVGSYLARALLKEGARVFGFLRPTVDRSFPKNLVDRGIEKHITYIEGDITYIYTLLNALDVSKPDVVFHLAAQSYVARSFQFPLETIHVNSIGTANVCQALKIKSPEAKFIFAGSSEEYGLVIVSENQYKLLKKQYSAIFPEPEKIPELPVKEKNPLRPVSPYATTKVFGDYLTRQYAASYGLNAVVSRGFNHEGAGRGPVFVTSSIARQTAELVLERRNEILLGNVMAFRDWSHVEDIAKGYMLLAEKGVKGEVYNQGSFRTNSVLTFLLWTLEVAGFEIKGLETLKNKKSVDNPARVKKEKFAGKEFEVSEIDSLLLKEKIEFTLEDEGIKLFTDKKEIVVKFDRRKFRPSEVPILLCDTEKIQKLGFKTNYSVKDIARDMLNFYLEPKNIEFISE